MEDKPINELYKIQISLTEWFDKIGHGDVAALRQEDNTKRDRLGVLQKHIGLPYDVPTRFSARQIVDAHPAFLDFLNARGQELCAMRLLPQVLDLPKLRTRGHTVRDAVNVWFAEQKIDPEKYLVEFMPHPNTHFWSTIFVVNEYGIFGEIIAESHQYLTQGFYTDVKPVQFSFDFEEWRLAPENPDAESYLKTLIAYLRVEGSEMQEQLARELGAVFSQNYLNGYFESVHSEFGTWFIDYSPRLGELYKDFTFNVIPDQNRESKHDRIQSILRKEMCIIGVVASPGIARGRVRIISDARGISLNPNDVLVCDMTSPDYVGLMQQACAIVTDRGGMLCHAAIIARELKKPCVVGTGNATTVLRDDEMVEVDAERGVVRKM